MGREECYWTVSLPGSIVGGFPKPGSTVRVSETGRDAHVEIRRARVGVYAQCFAFSHPAVVVFKMRQYIRCL